MPIKASELKDLDLPEIRQRLVEAEEELANLRFQLASHQLDNTAKVKIARRDVAKLKTVLHGREMEAATGGVKEA
jgi:large subunit ribosomal protein L29